MWIGMMILAILLVIAAMVDFCLSTPRMLALHTAVLLVLCGIALFLPRTPRAKKAARAFIGLLSLALIPAFLGVVIYANITATLMSRGKIFTTPEEVPATTVGLVFGTTDNVAGRENLYFRYRIDAAARLWNAGKIKTIIVSGDNRSKFYNEPDKMKQALIERGIPGDRIVCDFAGLRTLDSVVRAKKIFGVQSIVFISQRFQNERAIYLAEAHGMNAYGFDATDVKSHGGLKTKLREVGARVKMWLDVNFLNTRPKHLGAKEELPK